MLLAASESAVTKKPRLRLMMRRSSSVRPPGSFHVAMSRVMLTSWGIQWLEQAARYFSQAHLYLNGTSWLTSVWPLMMRLSAASMRRAADGEIGKDVCDRGEESTSRFVDEPLFDAGEMGLSSSSQVNISFPMRGLCETALRNAKCPFTSLTDCVAQLHRLFVRERRHFSQKIAGPLASFFA